MSTVTEKSFVLAGDIGGTKTNLGLFTGGDIGPVLHTLETFSSREMSSLEECVDLFLRKHPVTVRSVCFGVAGPVVNYQAKITNLPWTISAEKIKKQFGFETVILVNDLVATALSIPILPEKDLHSLTGVEGEIGGNRALIAPGTGLGMCLIPCVEGRYLPQPSEGGHINFGPNSEEEIQLYRYLHNRFGHVSYERLLSGSGLANIYNWLREDGFSAEPEWLANELKNDDPARIISENAIAGKDRQCEKALELFISIYGSATANLALTGLTTGGIFLGGGITPKVLDKPGEELFLQRFVDKGRYQGLLEKIPVKAILNDKAPLLGAAHHAIKCGEQESIKLKLETFVTGGI